MSKSSMRVGKIVSRELLLGKSVCSVCGRPASVDHTVDPQVLLTYLEPVFKWAQGDIFDFPVNCGVRYLKEGIQRGESCDVALRKVLSLIFSRNDT